VAPREAAQSSPDAASIPPDAPRIPPDAASIPPDAAPIPPDAASARDAAVPGMGLLMVSSAAPPATADLSAEGTRAWAHWCYMAANEVDRKEAPISVRVVDYGPGSFGRQPGGTTAFSWSDGTPTLAATAVHDSRYASRAGAGFEITVPAGTTPGTLKLYLGAFSSESKLEVSLGDGSAPAYADTSLVAAANQTREIVYTIRFAAGSENQTLTIRWYSLTVSLGWGNVTLAAATLQ
jgi:hypothetical protein